MKKSLVQRLGTPTLFIGLILMISTLIFPGTAAATLYTYTGPVFTDSYGTFPTTPAIGDSITVQFSYDGPLQPSENVLGVPFIMTCGGLVMDLPDNGTATGGELFIYAVTSGGLPSVWAIAGEVNTTPYDLYSMHATWYPGDYEGDGVGHTFGTETYADAGASETGTEGVWTASQVPLPPTALLFGSGLIPLAWARRRKRWGK